MQITKLSRELVWSELSPGRGVLEFEAPAGTHELAVELDVHWGDGGEMKGRGR